MAHPQRQAARPAPIPRRRAAGVRALMHHQVCRILARHECKRDARHLRGRPITLLNLPKQDARAEEACRAGYGLTIAQLSQTASQRRIGM